jgi:hypothetical protein
MAGMGKFIMADDKKKKVRAMSDNADLDAYDMPGLTRFFDRLDEEQKEIRKRPLKKLNYSKFKKTLDDKKKKIAENQSTLNRKRAAPPRARRKSARSRKRKVRR